MTSPGMVIIIAKNYLMWENREESVRRAEEMFHALDNDGNGDLTEVSWDGKSTNVEKLHTFYTIMLR